MFNPSIFWPFGLRLMVIDAVYNKASMKSNEVNERGFQNESTIYMSVLSRQEPLTNTKVIRVNPIVTTGCEDSPDPHSILYQDHEIMSQSSQTIRPALKQHQSQNQESSYPPWEEEQQSSIRKLYKQMMKEQPLEEEPIHFLYQSDRGEPAKENFIKMQPVECEKVEKHQAHFMTSKTSTDILYQPIPAQGMIECVVKLASSSFLSMEKQIQLYLMKQKKLLLRAKKSRIAVSSQYDVAAPQTTPVATFISNPSRTEYKYIKITPQENDDFKLSKEKHTQTTYDSTLIKLTPIKVELGSLASPERSYLVFRPNLLGMKQERLKIIRPKTKVGKTTRFSDIKASYENFQYDRLQIFDSKLAEKNIKGQLVLDFKTDKIMESARNLMIEDENGRICMTFYKRKQGLYVLSVMMPFTIIEAFFVAVSNLDHLFF